ncbi:MAG: DUF2283 domain-containing protein [Candidatus Aminicenantes bacterium]|nr:DUF2283 domain-containing protein [Candidatus Aminicenantes bacterium]
MQIKYFQDTDTLLVNFIEGEIVETRDLNENTLIELDKNGNLVSMTIEHAGKKTNMTDFSYQQVMGRAEYSSMIHHKTEINKG